MAITGPTSLRNEHIERGQKLTEREVQVLDLIVLGMRNQEIANKLTCTIKTVEMHVSNCMAKLGLGRRTLLAVYWDRATNPR